MARPAGLAQIRFVDDTRLVVGPNSRLVIDEFVFNPDQTAQQVTIRMAKGTFRFLSGNSPSKAYSIRTPTMTIGVRGTVLDVYAAVNGDESGAVFHDGGRRLFATPLAATALPRSTIAASLLCRRTERQ